MTTGRWGKLVGAVSLPHFHPSVRYPCPTSIPVCGIPAPLPSQCAVSLPHFHPSVRYPCPTSIPVCGVPAPLPSQCAVSLPHFHPSVWYPCPTSIPVCGIHFHPSVCSNPVASLAEPLRGRLSSWSIVATSMSQLRTFWVVFVPLVLMWELAS